VSDMKEPFLNAVPLLEKIEKAGYEAYFVGGSVRDLLIGREISDVDIASSATPVELKAIFPKTIDVGIEHGTIVILFNGMAYEVTTFRSESEYEDFRRPAGVEFIRSLQDDLMRRDFTMNAIAMDKQGKLIDPFRGTQAIKERMIRTVGDPFERFQEDGLRMMRAIRFHSQLGFEIEDKTLDALKALAPLLKHISVERKTMEFEKLLAGTYRKDAIIKLTETDIYQFLPGLADLKSEITHMAEYDCGDLSVEEMWALLLFQCKWQQKELDAFLKAWKLPVKKIQYIKSLLAWLKIRFAKNWTKLALYQAGFMIAAGAERLFNILHHQEANLNLEHLQKSYESLPIKKLTDLEINGGDLQEWFQKKPGPWIKEKLKAAEAAVINQEIENKKEILREWLSGCNQN